MNSYSELIEKVFKLSKVRGMNQSLSTISRLCEIYNHPEKTFPSIHVAGTNGKGSVCTKLAAILTNSGYRCGLYTSPHISTFRERIRIGKELISEEELSSLFTILQKDMESLSIEATFFEITTMMAFLYFQRQKIDIAIIETGLGGRWDATNVIDPLLSVITSIGLDHTEILGTTIEAIAIEKAGIIKKGRPIIIGPDVPYSIIETIAKERNSPLYQSTIEKEDYDEENQELTRRIINLLPSPFSVTDKALDEGLSVKPMCRFENHSREKEVIFDVAHNSHGFLRLIGKLRKQYPLHDYRFVVGFSKDKEVKKCAALIEQVATAIHIVSSSHPRLASVAEIQKAFTFERIPIYAEESVVNGVMGALRASSIKPEIIVITGSFFIMQEARKAVGLQDPTDPYIWFDPLQIMGKNSSSAL